jgi:hypothetical protein
MSATLLLCIKKHIAVFTLYVCSTNKQYKQTDHKVLLYNAPCSFKMMLFVIMNSFFLLVFNIFLNLIVCDGVFLEPRILFNDHPSKSLVIDLDDKNQSVCKKEAKMEFSLSLSEPRFTLHIYNTQNK